MTDGGTSRRIRIRIDGDDPGDLGALYRWLSLEDWFAQAEAERRITVVYRDGEGIEQPPGTDHGGPPMGGVTELVLVLAGAALAPVFEDMYTRAKVAVRAWADNSSTEERSVEVDVTPDADPQEVLEAGPAHPLEAGLSSGVTTESGPDDTEGGRLR
jgi:hypothetical protein